ncbi:MAG: PIG-L family deacetylase [Acidobacteriaceae bacterium]|jgi:LmbE family N-acetylglucosaminyl deacetylase
MIDCSKTRALILAPHTDDAELGCGGTIAKLRAGGAEVYVAAFSIAEDSVPPDAPKTILRDEFLSSMDSMGIDETHRIVLGYRVRRFPDARQEILEDMVRLKHSIAPTLVFLPASTDVHQDHFTVHSEGVRAFKEGSIWAYELPWNQTAFAAEIFVTLTREHLDSKWNALLRYRSQVQLARPYFSREFIDGLARVRGVQSRVDYAEAFELVRFRW